MKEEQFHEIAHLEGIEFIRALLRLEEQRFEQSHFLMGSTFEDINADFGIFPTMATYPVYFAGDICQPKNKIIFMGINPGFGEESNRKERDFLRQRGSFEGYCRLYGDFFKGRLVQYYSHIAGFLRRLYGITEIIDWDWFQEHFITLEVIPYHSVNANGLRINNVKKYREVYFEIILKLLRHLNPQKPIFINGFPTFRSFVTRRSGELLPEFVDAIEFTSLARVSIGKLGKRYDFIGLPFLTRPAGGKDALVAEVRELGRVKIKGRCLSQDASIGRVWRYLIYLMYGRPRNHWPPWVHHDSRPLAGRLRLEA